MAALTDLNDYMRRLRNPTEILTQVKTTYSAAVTNRLQNSWNLNNPVGAVPTTPVVPTRATAGCLEQQNNGGSLSSFILGGSGSGVHNGSMFLVDRLSHQAGLSGIVTGTQATNLPTAALTRYTSGEGVWGAYEIYVPVGATGTTITCTYVNQDGVTQTSPPSVFGSSAYQNATRVLLIPLVSGDTGIRAINDVNLLATTGAAGNFGITLFKPLLALCTDKQGNSVDFSLLDGGMSGGFPPIVDDACLEYLYITSAGMGPGQATVYITAV